MQATRKLVKATGLPFAVAETLAEAGFTTPGKIKDADDGQLPVDGKILADVRKVLPKR